MAEVAPPPSPPSPCVRPQAPLPRVPRSYAEDSNSQLHVACYTGAYNEALMLLLSGHQIAATNVWRETPLHQCTAQGHLDIMMLLLDAGADVNALDHQDLSPLHQALIHGNRDAAELLLSYGASVHNAEGVRDGLSALELASHIHVCHSVVQQALGRVWSLQHLCRIAIRRSLGVRKRRRIKELPLPKPVLSFLCSLPVDKSSELHQNWDRARSSKAEAVRKRGQAKRPKPTRYSPGVHTLRQQSGAGTLN